MQSRVAATSDRQLMPVLLWLTVLALIARMTIFVRQRTSTEFTAIDPSAAVEIALVGLTVALLLLNPRLGPVLRRVSRMSAGMLLLYYALCMVASSWSVLPSFSLFRSVEAASQYMAVFVALSYCSSFENAERRVLAVSTVALLCGIGLNLKLNGFAFSFEALHTNSYSTSAAVLCCYCLGEVLTAGKKRARLLKIYGTIALAAVIMGTSSASIIAALCGVAVAMMWTRRRGVLISALLIGALVLSFVIEGDMIQGVIFPGKTEAQIETLHGRTPLWEDFGEEIKANPVFGGGLGVAARLSTVRYTTNAHNALFAVLLSTGVMGLIVVLAGVAKLGTETLSSVRLHRPGAVGCAAALVAGLVNSMGLPIVGEAWMAPTLVFAGVLGLHLLYVVSFRRPGHAVSRRGIPVRGEYARSRR